MKKKTKSTVRVDLRDSTPCDASGRPLKVKKLTYKELETTLNECVAVHNALYDSWQAGHAELLKNAMRAVELGNEFADERDTARRELAQTKLIEAAQSETIAAQHRLLIEASKNSRTVDENILRMFRMEKR